MILLMLLLALGYRSSLVDDIYEYQQRNSTIMSLVAGKHCFCKYLSSVHKYFLTAYNTCLLMTLPINSLIWWFAIDLNIIIIINLVDILYYVNISLVICIPIPYFVGYLYYYFIIILLYIILYRYLHSIIYK